MSFSRSSPLSDVFVFAGFSVTGSEVVFDEPFSHVSFSAEITAGIPGAAQATEVLRQKAASKISIHAVADTKRNLLCALLLIPSLMRTSVHAAGAKTPCRQK